MYLLTDKANGIVRSSFSWKTSVTRKANVPIHSEGKVSVGKGWSGVVHVAQKINKKANNFSYR